MLKTTVRANEETDVEARVADLKAECERAGVAPHDSAMVAERVGEVLRSLVEHGRELATKGRHMNATQVVSGESYSVKLIFRVGDRRTWFQRLLERIRWR